MTTLLARGIGSAILALAATGVLAQQTSTNRVAARTDWSVFVEDDPTECWVVSSPNNTVNTRDNREVSVNRSVILMFVSYRPGMNVAGEVSFTGGYPFADGSTVQMAIGDSNYELFTTGENAWPASTADDAKIITAMKRGAEAVVVGRSSRGTRTEDTFSLMGFTAAIEEAENRCAG
ncbi:MAG: invasion associated locus B family protein [Halocynthiibacter sp.]